MKIFLDTCALFKLYHNELGSMEIESFFSSIQISGLFFSDITKIEFVSTVWKKVRMKDISSQQASELVQLFENDCQKFIFIQADNQIVELAKSLVIKYGNVGLRTLDSIQLATTVHIKNKIDYCITTDNLLNRFFHLEGLRTFEIKF